MIYAVIDTNVLVSALLTSNIDAATVKVVEALMKGLIVPLFDKDINMSRCLRDLSLISRRQLWSIISVQLWIRDWCHRVC